jgi:hypothetical protein
VEIRGSLKEGQLWRGKERWNHTPRKTTAKSNAYSPEKYRSMRVAKGGNAGGTDLEIGTQHVADVLVFEVEESGASVNVNLGEWRREAGVKLKY